MVSKRLLKERQRIVVLDDDKELLTYLRKLLKPFPDCDITYFSKASNKFFNFIQDNYVDLFIMDINLGTSQDGIDITENIIKNREGSIFLFISGYGYNKTIFDNLNGKCVYDYLTKPFDHKEIVIVISTLLNIASSYKESIDSKVQVKKEEEARTTQMNNMRKHYRKLLEEDKLLIKRLKHLDAVI